MTDIQLTISRLENTIESQARRIESLEADNAKYQEKNLSLYSDLAKARNAMDSLVQENVTLRGKIKTPLLDKLVLVAAIGLTLLWTVPAMIHALR